MSVYLSNGRRRITPTSLAKLATGGDHGFYVITRGGQTRSVRRFTEPAGGLPRRFDSRRVRDEESAAYPTEYPARLAARFAEAYPRISDIR